MCVRYSDTYRCLFAVIWKERWLIKARKKTLNKWRIWHESSLCVLSQQEKFLLIDLNGLRRREQQRAWCFVKVSSIHHSYRAYLSWSQSISIHFVRVFSAFLRILFALRFRIKGSFRISNKLARIVMRHITNECIYIACSIYFSSCSRDMNHATHFMHDALIWKPQHL